MIIIWYITEKQLQKGNWPDYHPGSLDWQKIKDTQWHEILTFATLCYKV